MSTINYLRICTSQGKEVATSTEDGPVVNYPPKPKSDATKLLERQEKGYTYRSNICSTCFEAKSRNGICSCSEQ